MEIVASALPFRIHNPQWRVGFVSAAAGASTAILLGLLLIYVISTLFDDRPVVWLVAVIGALMTASYVMAGGSLVLDVLELKGQVAPGMEERYNVVSVLALAKVSLAAFAALVVAISAFRSGRSLRRPTPRQAKRPSSVIVGSSSAAVPGGPVASRIGTSHEDASVS
jgi:hypothetical protein